MKLRPIHVADAIAFVPLTKGFVAIIDADDVPLVRGFNWRAAVKKRSVYAARSGKRGGRRSIWLHHVIMGTADGTRIDHIDCDGLNNRKTNLRPATKSQNGQNARLRSDNSSGLKGASWSKRNKKWKAQIRFEGKQHYLGLHETRAGAYAAYCQASARLHGEFGRTAT